MPPIKRQARRRPLDPDTPNEMRDLIPHYKRIRPVLVDAEGREYDPEVRV